MKFMFLSMVILGSNSLGQNIDVRFCLLIDELKQLWSSGALTYEVSRKQNFQMKANLMWTINDFPAYGMVSGWSMHEKLPCSYCKENNKAFTLTNDGKTSFFFISTSDSCQQITSTERIEKIFLLAELKRDVAPPLLSGEELYDVVSEYDDIVFDFQQSKQKFHGFAHNWVNQSFFQQFPYQKTNFLYYNLDVIHIENNIFENISSIVMDVKWKTKDNIKGRINISFLPP